LPPILTMRPLGNRIVVTVHHGPGFVSVIFTGYNDISEIYQVQLSSFKVCVETGRNCQAALIIVIGVTKKYLTWLIVISNQYAWTFGWQELFLHESLKVDRLKH